MSLFTEIQKNLTITGNSPLITGQFAGAAQVIAKSLINKYVPQGVQSKINTGFDILDDVQNGNILGAITRVFPQALDGLLAQAAYWGSPTPLFGGISPSEAKQIYDEICEIEYCWKNLFMIEISSNLYGDATSRFNSLVTNLDYAPFMISGEKHKIGAGHADSINSGDPTELKMTFYDTKDGFIKAWAEAHANASISKDGTVGLPFSYAIKITIIHGFITKESNRGGYQNMGWFRISNMDLSLSRNENDLAEVPLTFTQMDTFQL